MQSFFNGTSAPLRLAFLGFVIAGLGAVIAFSIDYGPHNALSFLAFGLGAFGVGLGFCAIVWGWIQILAKLVRGARAK